MICVNTATKWLGIPTLAIHTNAMFLKTILNTIKWSSLFSMRLFPIVVVHLIKLFALLKTGSYLICLFLVIRLISNSSVIEHLFLLNGWITLLIRRLIVCLTSLVLLMIKLFVFNISSVQTFASFDRGLLLTLISLLIYSTLAHANLIHFRHSLHISNCIRYYPP